MTTHGIALLDANILVYAVNKLSPYHAKAKAVRDAAAERKIAACITPQVLLEFFAICTDPRRIDRPLLQEEALTEFSSYLNCEDILKIYPGTRTMDTAVSLAQKYEITGQHIHDAHLIATILDNGVTAVYSGDAGLAKYKEITVINPFL